MPGAQRHPNRIRRAGGELWEYPPTVARIGPWNVPVAGGGYFRLFPLRFTQHCFRQVNAANQSVMFYLHPWEVDPEQPRVPSRPWQNWRHYVNLDKTERKLDLLLGGVQIWHAARSARRQWSRHRHQARPSRRARRNGAERRAFVSRQAHGPVSDASHAVPAG